MLEAISLDRKTLIIRSDVETDFSEIINFVVKKDKSKEIDSFLEFAEKNRKIDKEFKFSREECYDIENIFEKTSSIT
ncbi:MAG: hypothetical protein FWG66_10860 [Spirochaetes bacterium]|nr:hypothetical protein [Spirochaetota bacterium]